MKATKIIQLILGSIGEAFLYVGISALFVGCVFLSMWGAEKLGISPLWGLPLGELLVMGVIGIIWIIIEKKANKRILEEMRKRGEI